jgi:site-specific DNA recombinase
MQIKKCAIYSRVSTDMQAEKEFNSCETQELKIKRFIQSQEKFSIYKTYSDPGFSGGNLKRPALQELLSDIQNNQIDIVISYKIDRLTRSPKDFYHLVEIFDKHNVDFISVTERFDTSTSAGRLLRNIMLTFAAFKRELTSERVKDKMLERAKKGMWNGGFTPYGYMNVNRKLVAVDKEAKIIKLIFDIYLESGSLLKIYNVLKYKKMLYRKNKPFNKKTLSDILRNPIIAGYVKYDGKIFKGIHKPIISEDIFETAQELHKDREKKFRKHKNHLFAGIIKCGECGLSMTTSFINKHTKGNLKRYFYYRCISTLKRDWKSCGIKQVNSDKLEQYIYKNLERIYNDNYFLENLIFRLNHDLNTVNREGFEHSKSQIRFSKETLKPLLKEILKIIKQPGGAERNLRIKKYISGIKYSPEEIELELNYPSCSVEDAENLSVENLRAGALRSCAGSSEQVTGGVQQGTGWDSSLKVCSRDSGGPKTPEKTFKIIIPNELHKNKRHLKNI